MRRIGSFVMLRLRLGGGQKWTQGAAKDIALGFAGLAAKALGLLELGREKVKKILRGRFDTDRLSGS